MGGGCTFVLQIFLSVAILAIRFDVSAIEVRLWILLQAKAYFWLPLDTGLLKLECVEDPAISRAPI